MFYYNDQMANQEISQEVQYGAILPADLGLSDIVRFAQQAERLGFSFVVAYDQTILTPSSTYTDARGIDLPVESTADPFTILSAIAQETNEIELFTAVLALPQRQTVLVARQAADVDILSNGRLRLGVGIGFDRRVLNAYGRGDITNRRLGVVLESQVQVLKELWTQPTTTTTSRAGEVISEHNWIPRRYNDLYRFLSAGV